MERGKIIRLTDRGFGFISRAGEAKDLFFYAGELKNIKFSELKEGDDVIFEVKENERGLHATNIEKVNV